MRMSIEERLARVKKKEDQLKQVKSKIVCKMHQVNIGYS